MRNLLPLISSHPGGRSALTCRYRCGDACLHETPNTSDNAYVGDVIAGAASRRALLRAGAVVTVAAATGAVAVERAPRGRFASPLASWLASPFASLF
ncbi:phosphatase, partial [Streptomyces asiaticus]